MNEKELLEFLKKEVNEIQNMFNNNSITCILNIIEYINNKNENYLNKAVNAYNKLSVREKIFVSFMLKDYYSNKVIEKENDKVK